MANLGAMRTRIARELQIDATTFASEIDDAIFGAIAFYEDNDFWFKEVSSTKFVGTLTNEFALSTVLPDMSRIKDVVVHIGSRKQVMQFRTHSELIALDIDENYAGDPVYWSIHHAALIVEPKLRQSRTIEVFYSRRLSLTASASASSAWTTEAERLIRLRAEVDIAVNRMKDYATAERAKIQEMEELAKLDEKTVQQKSLRRVRPHL